MEIKTIAYSRKFWPKQFNSVDIGFSAELGPCESRTEAEVAIAMRELAILAHTAYEVLIKAGDPCDEKLKEEVLALIERKKNFNEHLLEQPCK